MAEENSENKVKSGVSITFVALGCALSALLGVAGGTFMGPDIKTILGLADDSQSAGTAEQIAADAVDPSKLFAPMPGVFSPDKDRFYADAGEFLVAIKYQGRTRYLQLSAQLVGHDEEFMRKVETDVPAIRNGLSIFFTQQDFSAVSTLEGREALRLATLVELNKIIGATSDLRVADVYFTDYITQ